jgi:hypothetical protein
MADLRERFALADRLDVPELWERASARAEQIPAKGRSTSRRREMRSRIVAAAVAVLVFVAAGAFLWDAFSRSGGTPAIEPQPSLSQPLQDGVSAGIEWSLVSVVPSTGASTLELRSTDDGAIVASVSSEGRDVPVVSGYAFGEGEPTDAVVFGLVNSETMTVTLIPGQGLPREEAETVPVPGSSMRAFAETAYAPIGIVRARDSSGDVVAEELLVLPGEEPVLRLVERFLTARVEGSGAEVFVARGARREFGPPLDLEPLYTTRQGYPYTDFAILFISRAGDSFEVGVRLDVNGSPAVEETLGVGQARPQEGNERLLVLGGRSGLTGP